MAPSWLNRLIVVALLACLTAAALIFLLVDQPASDRSLVDPALNEQEQRAALKLLSGEKIAELRSRETAVLKSNPMDRTAIFNLAVLADLEGDAQIRDKLLAAGARRSLRDTTLQTSAFSIALANKDMATAVNIFDGLLRSRPSSGALLFPAINTLLGDQNGLQAYVKAMNGDPPWRGAAFDFMLSQKPEGQVAYQYLSVLRKSGVPPTDVELRLMLGGMITRKQFDLAYFSWLDSMSPEQLAKAGAIYDGDFSEEPRGLFFDWTLNPMKNSTTKVALRNGNGVDRALVVVFTSSEDFYSGAIQYLKLDAGRYRFEAEAEMRNVKTDGGLVWRIYCLDEIKLLGQSQVLKINGPWMPLGFSFLVPEEKCGTQLLKLESATQTKLDLLMSGQYSFDKLKILPE